MKRTKIIDGAFYSYQPSGDTAPYGEGYYFHEDDSAILSYPGFQVTGMRSITDEVISGTTNLVDNDVYIDYTYLSGSTVVSGTTSIYYYPPTHITTTTTTTAVPTTTTTTTHAATTTTTTTAH